MPVVPLLAAAAAAAGAGAAAHRLRSRRAPATVRSAAKDVRRLAREAAAAPHDATAGAWKRLLLARAALGSSVEQWLDDEDGDAIRSWLERHVGAHVRLAVERARELSDGEHPCGSILVAGVTGAGKSTLVNAAVGRPVAKTGAGAPVTARTHHHLTRDGRAMLIDTPGLESAGAAATEVRAARLAVLAEVSDVVWYCVQGERGRVQSAEIELVERLAAVAPLIVVLTQSLEPSDELRREIEAHRLFAEVVSVLARERALGTARVAPTGLDALLAAHARAFARAE